jgi:hypothetical protein
MKVSEELQQQAERFSKTRSFALTSETKKELLTWFKESGYGKLNIGCSTCVRNAMGKLVQSISQGEHIMPRIHFIGTKQ